jgi:hypothetical protein
VSSENGPCGGRPSALKGKADVVRRDDDSTLPSRRSDGRQHARRGNPSNTRDPMRWGAHSNRQPVRARPGRVGSRRGSS